MGRLACVPPDQSDFHTQSNEQTPVRGYGQRPYPVCLGSVFTSIKYSASLLPTRSIPGTCTSATMLSAPWRLA